MSDQKGSFFVLEGIDGSGKGTQYELLLNQLKEDGYDVVGFDFPQYSSPSSYFVKEFLNGKYGSTKDVGPYTGSLFYALDRFESAREIKKALDAGKIVIANRFTGSSMAHQGTNFMHAEERRGFFIWLDNLEFELLDIPRPTKSFVLRVPLGIAQGLIKKKDVRDYTSRKTDLTEKDLNFQSKSVEVYDDLCQLFPKDFEQIDCIRDGKIMNVSEIQKIIRAKIDPLLPKVKKGKNMTSEAEYLREVEGRLEVTDEGRDFLSEIVTDVNGDVYAFTDKLGTMTIAAAMARLSRRGDDMRVTILDEFTDEKDKDEQLLKRVITAYGDDSVQQLTSLHLVVEGASNLLTKQLERGRLASYLEQSTRYIYFDERDKAGKYKYYTPERLPQDMAEDFNETIDKIFDTYSEVVRELTDYIRTNSDTPESERNAAWRSATKAQACDTVRPLLPVATRSTVGIHGSGQAIESMIMRLRAEDSAEARRTGNALLSEARKVMPVFFERADKPDRGGATTMYLAETRHKVEELGRQYLPNRYGEVEDEPTLLRYEPRNELDIVPYMLYQGSNLPLEDIQAEVENWPYDKKVEIFQAYVGDRYNRRHRPNRAMEQLRYSWDIMCDYGIFRDLQRHRMVDQLEWQPLTPRYGFEVPKLVEDAGLADKFEECFDLSFALYSRLQAAGFEYEAQYATLLGHRMRWTVTYNARQAFHIHELRTTPQGHPGYRKLTQQLHDKIAEVHPLTAEAMKFVNQDEDPELTRLAAEQYTEFKLKQLDSND